MGRVHCDSWSENCNIRHNPNLDFFRKEFWLLLDKMGTLSLDLRIVTPRNQVFYETGGKNQYDPT